ncbi:glycosyltransferase [Mucilaginibacter segetis]|uniref:Glycosyltransferase family 4 protein n=1 Tax=Mucilaginibacter segetis TaxID=2793071 RepID=A0A934UPB1_9SPHI|nr:glycosyltransferase [Mucilaginibacter segetis]MBK0381234.1 glycosyltransferase family 4 protein [Mucilaginibacter segetis]
MKKILYFFPDNVGVQTAGNKARAIQLLKFFKERGYQVDFVSLKHETADSETEQDTIDFLTGNKLAQRVYLLPRKPHKNNYIVYFFKYKLWNLFYYWFNYPAKSKIPTFLTIHLKHAFNNVLKNDTYNYIIISYVQCADLISNKRLLKGAKTIIDTHDLITAQFKDKRHFNLGVTFQDEIDRLSKFDEVWAISYEEQYIFAQFCRSQVRLVPLMADIDHSISSSASIKKYDLIYVASDNVHNKRSADWFFEKVYPLLPNDINICVIGLINKTIPEQYKIKRVLYAAELGEYYRNAKIALCPMLTGTGVKVKVVEALAYGLPVVCTARGTDGLPNKEFNGCLVSDDATEFANNIIKLLNNKDLYISQSALAKQLINVAFSKNVLYEKLDRAFN